MSSASHRRFPRLSFAVAESALDDLKIESTWVDGEAVYQRKQDAAQAR